MVKQVKYLPTPVEIEQRCAEIRQGWDYLQRLHALGLIQGDELESRKPVPPTCFLTVESNCRDIF